MNQKIIVQTTVPDFSTCEKISHILFQEKLCACIQYHPMNSIYLWKNKLNNDNELILTIKTVSTHYKKIEALILKHHPYETPEIICFLIQDGYSKYLEWVEQCVKGDEK